MSIAEVYITTGIHNLQGTFAEDNPYSRTPATIRGQITQYHNLKIAIPRKNYRTADLSVNLLSSELAQFYTTDDPNFDAYRNFLYIKWNNHLVFWGPIITKEIDFEGMSLTLHAKDQGARCENNFFKIGDVCLDGVDPGGKGLQWPFASTGHLTLDYAGIGLALKTVNDMEYTRVNFNDASKYPPFIPLGVKMGDNNFTATATQPITIQRGQEVWRTMLDMGDRTDGPLFEFVPMDISDGAYFAQCNVYGQFRRDISGTVKFHYNTGLHNVRNLQPVIGGEVKTHVNTVTRDNRWNCYSIYFASAIKYGIWLQWDQVDWSIGLQSTSTEVIDSIGRVGDATLDAYATPLVAVTITLPRDDQIGLANQFYYIQDYLVADIVEISGARGPESFSGKYLIDEVRLEQEPDNSGQIRQAMDVIPWVDPAGRTYLHAWTKSRPPDGPS